MTGTLGAAIFVLLALEGLTILRVDRFMWLHVLIGMALVAFASAKIGSTTYRFVRYYTGQRDYIGKGPPPIILRALGPVVTLTTIAVLGTGIGTVLTPRSHWLALAHKASFIVWFGTMTLHVLGHALETPALASADWTRLRRNQVTGATARFALLITAAIVALALAFMSSGWADRWLQVRGR